MNHGEIHTQINTSNYDAIISLGNKCPTAMILRKLGIYKESYPFDYVPTTPELVLKYIKNPLLFYPGKGDMYTRDGVWFGHFNTEKDYDITVETFKKRFDRLFSMLENKKRILFVYTSEADMYNEMNNRYNDNYGYLKSLHSYISESYRATDFMILAVHTNKEYPVEPGFIHYTIHVDQEYLSDNQETHTKPIVELYRNVLTSLFTKIFLDHK
jgi:hypothetical protein